MNSVGLKTLKNKLSEYVRLAAAGETVVITDRNRIVAEIVPPRRAPSTPLIERGCAKAGSGRRSIRDGLPPPSKPVPGLTLEQLMADLERDREDPVIYIDSSVALARLLLEPRSPPERLWEQRLVSSRLLEYEVWNRVHAYGLTVSHGNEAQASADRASNLVEMSRPVLARALEPLPTAAPHS